jgi:gag-polyprotein putative aspartyl protease/Aspartyl protease
MRAFIVAIALCLVQPSTFSQGLDNSLKTLYEGHRWFALRDATAAGDEQAFYHAAVEAAFDEIDSAKRDLGKVIVQSPHSTDAYEAHELLTTMFFRHGLYREALEQLRAMSNERPDAKDVQNEMGLFTVLGKVDQSTIHLRPSTLRMRYQDGNPVYLPTEINGEKALYAFDTGANFSVISEAEASRFGMAVSSVDTSIGDSSGNHLGIRVAVAKSLNIGGLQLRNVAFVVLPDTQPPFNGLVERKRGLLGIPVLLAMGTFSWSKDGAFSLGLSSERFHLQTANLAFEESFPITHAYFRGTGIDMTVDSGAEKTVLSPPFASRFPDVLKSIGKPESHSLTGLAGSASYKSVLLPSLDLQVGGHTVTLKNVHVLTEESSDTSKWADGNLGIDLLNEARSVTIDFRAMTLTLR